MQYDATRLALLHPERQPPLDPALFAASGDGLAAELARLAYFRFEDDPAPLKAALNALGLAQVGLFNDPAMGSQGFAAMDAAGTAWIAFRGTQPDSLKDLATDARAWQREWPGGGRVHAGFARAWLGAEDGLAGQVVRWLGERQAVRIVATGHSLGAALATLLAAGDERAELVTFGSPRVGDRAFAARFAGRAARRYVDCCDLITRVPPGPLYTHFGKLKYADRHGRLHTAPDEALIAADRRAGSFGYLRRHAWRPGNVLLRGLADHAPVNYISAVLGLRLP